MSLNLFVFFYSKTVQPLSRKRPWLGAQLEKVPQLYCPHGFNQARSSNWWTYLALLQEDIEEQEEGHPLWNQGQCQGWNVGLKGSPFLQRDHSIHSPMVPKVSTQVKKSVDSWITWFGVVFMADFHWSRSGSTCKCRERRWQTGQTFAGKFASIPSSRTGRSSRSVAQESKWKLTRVNSLGWSTGEVKPGSPTTGSLAGLSVAMEPMDSLKSLLVGMRLH